MCLIVKIWILFTTHIILVYCITYSCFFSAKHCSLSKYYKVIGQDCHFGSFSCMCVLCLSQMLLDYHPHSSRTHTTCRHMHTHTPTILMAIFSGKDKLASCPHEIRIFGVNECQPSEIRTDLRIFCIHQDSLRGRACVRFATWVTHVLLLLKCPFLCTFVVAIVSRSLRALLSWLGDSSGTLGVWFCELFAEYYAEMKCLGPVFCQSA